jgi:hypothetical protein
MEAKVVKVIKGRTCYIIKVQCCFCEATHLHGGGDLKGEIFYGSRVSHCGKGQYTMVVPENIEIE